MSDSEEEDLTLSLVLLSTFVKEPQQNFESFGDLMEDPDGKNYGIYTENGITYINKGSNPNLSMKKKLKFEKKVTLPDDGDLDHEELYNFTKSLKEYTEDVNDISVTEFHVQWGINDDETPYLLGCDGSKYKCKKSSEPYSTILKFLVLYEALEISQVPSQGQCFVGNNRCLGSDMTMLRQKIETVRVRKFLKSFQYDDKPALEKYVLRRMSSLCPPLLMTSVPICKRCFQKYMRLSRSTKTDEYKKADTSPTVISKSDQNSTAPTVNGKSDMNSTSPFSNNKSRLNNTSNSTGKSNHPDNISVKSRSVTPSQTTYTPALNSNQNANNSSKGNNELRRKKAVRPKTTVYNSRTKSSSGLIYYQNFAMSTLGRANRIYRHDPFPAFFRKQAKK